MNRNPRINPWADTDRNRAWLRVAHDFSYQPTTEAVGYQIINRLF